MVLWAVAVSGACVRWMRDGRWKGRGMGREGKGEGGRTFGSAVNAVAGEGGGAEGGAGFAGHCCWWDGGECGLVRVFVQRM